jgi:ribosomal-protein-alanine N-acetyltransferase
MRSSNIIETPRLLLRMETAEEYKRILESYDDAALMQYFGLQETELELEKMKVKGGICTYRTDVVFFHLIEKTTQHVIGSCNFHNWFRIHQRSEIGYALRREEYKNKGFMREALLPIVDYGFTTLNLNRIEAFIGPENMPSQRLVQRLGFRQEGHLRGHYCKDGVIGDSLVFGLLRDEFEQKF